MDKSLLKKFPLWENDGKAVEKLEESSIQSIATLLEEINRNDLVLKKNHCLCHNVNEDKDIVISEKDRYGLPIPQVLCSKCGLIRSGLVFDEPSNTIFYRDYYRKIYVVPGCHTVEENFNAHQHIAEHIFNNVKKHIGLEHLSDVAEVGCSCGYNLYNFHKAGKHVQGFDFNKEYLAYGSSKGMDLRYGDFYEQTEDDSFDLVILNHVFEHLLDPIADLKKLVKKIRKGKYLYIEVPGIYCIPTVYRDPLTYFQNAHVYNFYADWLRVLFEKFGMNVIYGDERCTFICQKTSDCEFDGDIIYDGKLNVFFEKNAEFLIDCDKQYRRNKAVTPIKKIIHLTKVHVAKVLRKTK